MCVLTVNLQSGPVLVLQTCSPHSLELTPDSFSIPTLSVAFLKLTASSRPSAPLAALQVPQIRPLADTMHSRGVATRVDIGIYTPPPKSAQVNFYGVKMTSERLSCLLLS